jgi:hypothetical protein
MIKFTLYTSNTSGNLSNCIYPKEILVTDDYGNITWNHAALVVISRATYEKINWENFIGENLWDIADEVSRESGIVWD